MKSSIDGEEEYSIYFAKENFLADLIPALGLFFLVVRWQNSTNKEARKKQPALTRSLTEGEQTDFVQAATSFASLQPSQPAANKKAAQESDVFSHAGSRPCSRDGTGGTLRGRCSVWGPQSVEVYARRPRVIGRAPSDV